MMFLWIIVLIAVIAGAWYFTQRRKNNPLMPDDRQKTAQEVLQNRYAKGEITKEEYEERKQVLEEKEFM